MSDKPILVTGAHRSGTTWVGKMLALAPGVAYIHEPFSPKAPKGLSPAGFERYFTVVTSENEGRYRAGLKHSLALRYDVSAQLRSAQNWRDVVRIPRYVDEMLDCVLQASSHHAAVVGSVGIRKDLEALAIVELQSFDEQCCHWMLKKIRREIADAHSASVVLYTRGLPCLNGKVLRESLCGPSLCVR